MSMPGWTEIIVIAILVLILFGSAKIPAMAKNVANGIKTFKKEMKEEPKKVPTKKKSVSKKK